MKTFAQAFSMIALGCLPLAAEDAPAASAGTGKPPNGQSDKIESPGRVFTSDNRIAVIKFFQSHKDEPNGLPADWSRPSAEGMPVMWRTGRISVGEMITEKHRAYLLAAPADLVALLPAGDSRYYVAGSNVIAVDAEFRVLDDIRVSTIKFPADESTAAAGSDATEKTGGSETPIGRDGKQGKTVDENALDAAGAKKGDGKPITEEHEGRDGKQGQNAGE